MTNRKKAARLKEDLLQQRHAQEAEMSSTKAWLFLEHLSATPVNPSRRHPCNGNGHLSPSNDDEATTSNSGRGGYWRLKTPLSSLAAFFVMNFAQITSSPTSTFLNTVFLHKRKNTTKNGGCGEVVEPVEHAAEMSFENSDKVFVSTGFEGEKRTSFNHLHPDLKGLSASFDCELPAIYLPEDQYWITGLCSVVRYVLLNYGDASAKGLLGHNLTTLSAPAEVSIWTKFVEIDLPKATTLLVNHIRQLERAGDIDTEEDGIFRVELPEEFAKFEAHLSQPVRMHNIRKRMQRENFQASNNSQDPINEYARSQHKYAEGPDCLLSDAMLFVHYFLFDQELNGLSKATGDSRPSSSDNKLTDLFGKKLPLTCDWYLRVLQQTSMGKVATQQLMISRDNDVSSQILQDLQRLTTRQQAEESSISNYQRLSLSSLEIELPQVKNQSLYVSDPARINPASRSFTRPGAIDAAFKWFEESGIKSFDSSAAPSVYESDNSGDTLVTRLNWNELPDLVHPLHGGKLPKERAGKKCHQLENMAIAVMKLVKSRSPENQAVTVVDFCSGGGHLAILLAHLLPNSTFILVENKAESLQRAIERTKKLHLTNCQFFQGNLDYFRGSFDIGVSVHACGVATDLVLKMCVDNRADFVSCPCCYGKVQENHVLSYPRSSLYQRKNPGFETYVVIGHTADQTHFTEGQTGKAMQGSWAMDVIDTDRLQMASEAGYTQVTLTKLHPPECTPKNNLLIGRF